MATNPLILDAQALKRLPVPNTAITQMPSGPLPVPASVIAAPTPNVSLAPMAGPSPSLAAPPMPSVLKGPDQATQNTISRTIGDQAEYQRKLSTGSGISQIKNHFLRGLARVGDVAESIIVPGAAAFTPGTELNHQRLLNQDMGRINNDLGNQQEQAQTTLLDAQPQLKQMAAENNMLKTAGYLQHVNDQGQHYDQQYVQNLRDHGYAPDESDPSGQKLRPLRYEEMSGTQQAVEDLKHAQAEEAEAAAAMKKAQNDPTSPAFLLAKQRADVAQQNAQIARGRLGLQGQRFEMQAHGTQNGVALPGAMIDDNGNTIGTAFQGNVRPTGTERNKGDMAASAAEQLADIKSIMQKHPTLFGPGYGQTSAFRQWIGSQDPDAQRFMAARTIAADHLAGTFGGRSEAALSALDNAIGQFKDNPQAAIAGVDQLTKANVRFQNVGTPRTAGSKAGNAMHGAPKTGDIVDGYKFKGGDPGDQKNWVKQ